jgi:hypothetical protein
MKSISWICPYFCHHTHPFSSFYHRHLYFYHLNLDHTSCLDTYRLASSGRPTFNLSLSYHYLYQNSYVLEHPRASYSNTWTLPSYYRSLATCYRNCFYLCRHIFFHHFGPSYHTIYPSFDLASHLEFEKTISLSHRLDLV